MPGGQGPHDVLTGQPGGQCASSRARRALLVETRSEEEGRAWRDGAVCLRGDTS